MREEKYYGVFDYGDALYPGAELKIEHSVVDGYADNALDITPFISLGVDNLTNMRDKSIESETAIFEKIRASVREWERQAAVTKSYNRALEYLNTHKTEHTSNQWVHQDYIDQDTISNMVYFMNVSVWEDTKYDYSIKESVPVAWYVTWRVGLHSPKNGGYGREIASQVRKRYTDKEAAQKYIEGRKKAYEKYFQEISPPIPQMYAEYFKVNGVLLPGYTIQGEEPTISTKTADEIIGEILGVDSAEKDKKPSVLKKLSEGKKETAPTRGAKDKEEQSL